MLIKTHGSAVHGVNAVTITIEVNVSNQGVGYSLVGLPDNAVKEGHHRIETAVKNMGLKMPRLRVVINMAPADIAAKVAQHHQSVNEPSWDDQYSNGNLYSVKQFME